MGFALPSGVVNTDSAYFYVDSTLTLGPLVKQTSDQTLVVVDYSSLGADVVVDSYGFTVDVSSNPALVISYPDMVSGILTFLLSGGINGQQYNITIISNVSSSTRNDVLTVNIPSFAGDCVQINPVPTIYTQIPLGEPTQGYVNTGVRYFWGVAPPMNPNVMDQWYDPTTQTLSEWVTDGVNFFWEIIMSAGLVTDAPSTNLIYGRYNGVWVVEPIQADAPADGAQYVRRNNSWYQISQYVTEAPGGTIRYGRYNGTWQPDAIQTDAPNDGNFYTRYRNGWQSLAVNQIVTEAPQNGVLYSRINGGWQPDVIQADAPPDGKFYARNNRAWLPIDTTNLLVDAPTDGTLYGRQDSAWVAAYPAGNPANYTSAAQVAAAVAPMMPRQGGTFNGAISVPGFIVPNGPASMQISGGQVGQVLAAANTSSTLAWAAPGTPEAPQDGIAYARQNGVWVPTASGAGVPEAPSDGTAYVRMSAAWTQLDTTDITDWATATSALLQPYALFIEIPLASTTFPLMDGTNAIGVAATWARADHVHPTDTSRYAASNPAGYQTAAQVTAALAPYALIANVPVASNAVPAMNGVGSSGSAPAFTRGDHVHPTDTTRLAIAGGAMTGLLTLVGNPVGNLDAVPLQYVTTSVANANIDCGAY
jgi:hypothetical protein